MNSLLLEKETHSDQGLQEKQWYTILHEKVMPYLNSVTFHKWKLNEEFQASGHWKVLIIVTICKIYIYFYYYYFNTLVLLAGLCKDWTEVIAVFCFSSS